MLNKKLVLTFLLFMASVSVAVSQDKTASQEKSASKDSDTASVERAVKHGDFLCYDVLVFSDRQVSQKIASQ